jgi:sialate O-acetylesterase
MFRLAPMPTSAEPRVMTIRGSGATRTEIKNVVVGEVWLCGGQSNIEVGVGDARNPKQEQQEAKYPLIRVATVGWAFKPSPQDKPTIHHNQWRKAIPENILGLTAVGYFFGRELHQKLNVPIGLIHASKGGTPAEAWMPKESLLADAELAWTADRALYDEYTRPGELYNAMIHPLAPYRVRGAIWYQGENNLFRGWTYRKTLPTLIARWRKLWNVTNPNDFPFGIVQLAGQGTAFDFAFMNSVWAERNQNRKRASHS